MTEMPIAVGRRRRLSTRRKLGISHASVVGALVALFAGAAGALVSPSPDLVLGSAAVLALILLLLWQENEPPLLMFPALYQWLAVATKPMMTIFLKTPVAALAEFNTDIVPGVWLGLAAVSALTIGMRLGLGRPVKDWNAALKQEALLVSRQSILKVAISAVLLGHLLFFLMRYTGPASQLVYALANVRFLGLFALAYWCFVNRQGYHYLALVMAIEVLIGITGFFSDFKAPIFIIAFAGIAAGHRPKLKDTVVVAGLVVVLVTLGSFWSAIKMDYRNFVSGGTMQQEIVVPLSDRISYLSREVKSFNRDRFVYGLDSMLRRQSYIDFLASTMSYIPEVLPHEHGARIGRTLVHVMTPRVFFPNKPPTEFDSEVTAHYTGLPLLIREGTSISIGYVGEFYIDFGKTGAVICCLILGFGFGLAYRYISRHGSGSLLLTYGSRTTALVVLLPFDVALIKYVGGAGMAFIAAYLLQRFAVPFLSRQLRLKRGIAAAPRGAHA